MTKGHLDHIEGYVEDLKSGFLPGAQFPDSIETNSHHLRRIPLRDKVVDDRLQDGLQAVGGNHLMSSLCGKLEKSYNLALVRSQKPVG